MTSPPAPHGARLHRPRATRTRILEAARQVLGQDPDSSLGAIAEAAGVARRTVYGHFAGRAALIEGLTADAAEAVRLAIATTRTPQPHPDPATALAHFVLTLWPVGDRYRTLIRLAPQDLGTQRVSALLAPARDTVAAILARGQRQGVFHTSVPPGPLSRALEALLLALLDSVNSGIWADDGTSAATAALIAVGVDRGVAASTVRRLARHTVRHAPHLQRLR
ncbi:TetR/AcrR family transcriptional regulator [Streptomyces sp. Qhu-G9]|uniref:TetR/AcrR family transcriptional regulator n=1 Tax=Streptomyces sp. Qhu-G9 TaxID=3452799 RepID=UPI0022AC858C|nr:TetR/AcrR family transcriptional regulator [Streptomyces aurantiacus]WAU82520.1 TetR/AcrR family transcriptional regulator [Streptomyces aurantiacus]